MRKLQSRLTIALLFTALALITFFVTAFISSPIDFLYRNASGLSTTRQIAEVVSLLALVLLFIAGFIVAIPVALQPAGWLAKVGKVLPIYLLLFALVGILSGFIGIGQVGNLLNLQGVGQVTFIAAWLGLAAVLATLAVVIAAGRSPLGASTLKSAVRTTVAASGLSALATVAMLASVVIVATSTPSGFGGGPGGGGQFPGGGNGGNRPGGAGQTTPGQNNGNRPNGQNGQGQGQLPGAEATGEPPQGAFPNGNNGAASSGAPSGQGQQPQPAVTSEAGNGQASAAFQAQSTAEPQAGSPNGAPSGAANSNGNGQGQRPEGTGQPQGGFPAGGGNGAPQGGFPLGGPGGPGGGTASIVPRYEAGGALMTIFAVIGLVGAIGGLTAAGQFSPAPATTVVPVSSSREVGRALISAIGMSVVVFLVIQVIPVTRDNPPVKTPINWDSEQTKQLVYASCMDCHSNESKWPWYSYIAPSSWLTTMHVHDGRQMMNLSDLDSMPAFQRAMLANNMANQIRSGSMPPKDYLILHPDARLTDEQKEQLIEGLQKSLPSS